MAKNIFIAILLILQSNIGLAQTKPPAFDTDRLTAIVSNFTRLAYTKSDMDSLIGYMGFPLYIHEGKAKRVFASAVEMRKELQKKYKREKFNAVGYLIDSISSPSLCPLPDLKARTCICLTAHVVLPEIGNGVSLMTTFYLDRRAPYKVIATVNH